MNLPHIPLAVTTLASCSLGAAIFLNVANRYGLHDHPSGRSSHYNPTVTGMGIIVVLATLIYMAWQWLSPNEPKVSNAFFIGFILLTGVSFLDDIFFLKHSLRLIVQIISVALILYSMDFHSNGIEKVVITFTAMVFAVGVINAYNFMDGVNGMLALHSIVVLASFLFLNENLINLEGAKIQFANSNFITTILVSICIFAFFNLRKRAIAFIGDVGSVGIAMIMVYLMYSLLLKTGNYTYLLLFVTFGADAGLTVCYKLILRENIFVPHRDFLFKKLVHIGKFSHLQVAAAYCAVQAIINIGVLSLPQNLKPSFQLSILFIVILVLVATYITLISRLGRRK